MNEVHKKYRELKAKHPDAIILFRTGDFYVTYDDDADVVSKLLGITRLKCLKSGLRSAGFPHHALDTYLPKLVRAGHRVAICEQIEDPNTKKLVKRGSQELTK